MGYYEIKLYNIVVNSDVREYFMENRKRSLDDSETNTFKHRPYHFLLRFNAFKTEQPLRGIVLHGKEEKIKSKQKSCLEKPKDKNVSLTPDLKASTL